MIGFVTWPPFITIYRYEKSSLVPRPYELGSGDTQYNSVVQTAEIVSHQSNSKQVQTTKNAPIRFETTKCY